MKLLIIEDEEKLARTLKLGLEKEGFTVDYVLNGEEGLLRLERYPGEYSLVILDVMLPGRNGYEICSLLRKDKKIALPIIMLTARNTIDDTVRGLNSGADDYLEKPFSFDELCARVRSLLRRPSTALPPELKINDVVLDPASHKVVRGDKEIKLTKKEYSLLEYFMRRHNEVISRDELLGQLWEFDTATFSNVIDIHIKNLRKKLHDKDQTFLETVRGVGYRLKG